MDRSLILDRSSFLDWSLILDAGAILYRSLILHSGAILYLDAILNPSLKIYVPTIVPIWSTRFLYRSLKTSVPIIVACDTSHNHNLVTTLDFQNL